MSSHTTIHSGWLHKRYPVIQGTWQRRWCTLRLDCFRYYKDETCKFMTGSVKLQPNTAVVRFCDEFAPSVCPNIFRSTPFGFIVDTDPASGAHRQLLYFSAGDREALDAWIWFLLRAAFHAAEVSRVIKCRTHAFTSWMPCWQISISSLSAACDPPGTAKSSAVARSCTSDWEGFEHCASSTFDESSSSAGATRSTAYTESSPSPNSHGQYSPSTYDISSDVGSNAGEYLEPLERAVSYHDVGVGTEGANIDGTCSGTVIDDCVAKRDIAVGTDACFLNDVTLTEADALEATVSMETSDDVNFSIGDRVCLGGLQSERGTRLNGLNGVLLKFEDAKDRWQVRLDGTDEVKLVKTTNLGNVAQADLCTSISCLSSSFMPRSELTNFVGSNTCTICFEPFLDSAITITRCGHVFHMRCLARANGSACPQCRQSIDDPTAETPQNPERDHLPSRELLSALLWVMAGPGHAGQVESSTD